MQQVPPEIWATLERRFDEAQLPASERTDCHKWVRFYLDFCHKYGHPTASSTSLGPFLAKLASKNQSVAQRSQASVAIGLLLQPDSNPGPTRPSLNNPPPPKLPVPPSPKTLRPAPSLVRPLAVTRPLPRPSGVGQERPAAPLLAIPTLSAPHPRPPAPGSGASWQEEYRDLEAAILLRNYSTRTLETYRFWVVKFQAFVRSRPTADLGTSEVRGFLSELAVRHRVAASTQNQAFNALLFFYRHVLGREFGKLDGVVRPKRHRYVPVVLSRSETDAVLGHLRPPYRLVGLLLYGCGLRLAECVNLRVQCFNLDSMLLTIHDGKGQKDRTVPLPARVLPEIRQQMDLVRRLHAQDLAAGYAGTFLPRQLEKKYKNAAKEFIWQWFFPAPTLTFVSSSREHRRYHLHETHVQGAVKQAATRAAIPKRVSPHTFVIRSQAICCWRTTTCKQFKSCWDTATSRPP